MTGDGSGRPSFLSQAQVDRISAAVTAEALGPRHTEIPLAVRVDLWREGGRLSDRLSAVVGDVEDLMASGLAADEAIDFVISRSAAPRQDPVPRDLFVEHPKTGELRADPTAFLRWFRTGERFVVPVERGTFAGPSAFELLRYEGGYFNGMARAFVRGRVEDAFRSVGLASTDGFREEVVKGIAATSEFHRRREAFNPANLLCLANGILDTATGGIRPHTPEIVFTWKLPIAYDPAAACPAFEAFLERVQPDPARRRLVVDLMGYCLWRRNPFQTFFVNVGDGANGKTTWLRVMEELLGPDAIAAESLQNLSSQRFAPAELEGKLANLCDDLPYDRPLAATGVLKILTGEGEFTGERKFLPKFKFRFEGKLITNANRTPEVRDDTYAFWRRLVAIPWEVTIPEGERDPRLIDRLRAELPGILNLALGGLARCRERAEFDPDGVFENSKEEWHRRSDPVRAELLAAFEPCPGAFVTNERIREWHVQTCESQGREPMSDESLGNAVNRTFPLSRSARKQVHGRSVWGRPGIRERVASPGSTLDIDITRQPTWEGQKEQFARARDAMARLQGSPDGTFSVSAYLDSLTEIGLSARRAEAILQTLRNRGEVIETRPEKYQLVRWVAPSTPATVVSREKEGGTSPALAGGSVPAGENPDGPFGAGSKPPATAGDAGGPGGVVGSLTPAYPEPRSATDDKPPRRTHRNCRLCTDLESHVCDGCEACRWAENHGDEGGG